MKRPKRIAKGVVKATGLSFKKALAVLVPPKILKESSFFGGLNRMSDAVVNLGSESKESESKGKQYVIRKAGGTVADGAIGLALFGLPMTLVTSLFSDGCKVVSKVLRDAGSVDKEAAAASYFFGDMSAVSNNFAKLFDVPSKEVADDIHSSISEMAERLKNEGRLTKELEKELDELDSMRVCKTDDVSEWFSSVQERLSRIAEVGSANHRVCCDVPEIRDFIQRPTVANMGNMKDSILRDLNKRNVPVRDNTKTFIDSLVNTMENFSTAEFQSKLRILTSTGVELAEKTEEKASKTAQFGYRIMNSLMGTTYKGASLFGQHYKKQIECAVDKKKCD
jgi:hypothetical protein